MWKIGNIDIKNKVVLASMAGISNFAYMKICEEMGVGYAITELISSEAIIRENKKTLDMLQGYEKLNIPVAIQLFGSNIESMVNAAKYLEKNYQFPIIDINLGCPVPKVASKAGAGSALLKDSEKVYKLIKAVSSSVNVPVTVKIRSGWDQNSINATQIAQICEKAGAKAIAVHPRTRSQGYSGKADWNIIKDVKQNVKIPVIGNGDIKTKEDTKAMMQITGCDAIMIGRAAIGNPWIIKDCVNYLEGKTSIAPTNKDKIIIIKKHLNYLLETKPEKVAASEIRMHISHYLKGMPQNKEIKDKIFKTKDIKNINQILDDYYKTML